MIRRFRSAPSVVVPLLVMLAISGCAAPPEPAVEPSPVQPLPSASPSATAELPVADGPPPVAELVLRPDGIGDLTIGTAEGIGDDPDDMVRLVDDYCANARGDGYPGAGTAEADGWVPIDQYRSDESDEISIFETAVVDGRLLSVEVALFSDITTAEGIGIGSTRAEVEAAYPNARVEAMSPESEVIVVRTASHQLQIEVLLPDVLVDPQATRSAQPDSVIGMRAVPADEEPRARWRTGDVLGPCGTT